MAKKKEEMGVPAIVDSVETLEDESNARSSERICKILSGAG